MCDLPIYARTAHCYYVTQVNNNTIHNWASLNDGYKTRRVQPILYTDLVTSTAGDDALVTSARHLGWAVLQVPRVSNADLPFLKDMYFDAAKRFPECTFYGFANGDILFNRGLVSSLEAIAQVSLLTAHVVTISWCFLSFQLKRASDNATEKTMRSVQRVIHAGLHR